MKNELVLKCFVYGMSGKSKTLESTGTQLIGYGNAIYADLKNGVTIVYTGWRGFSKTTTVHINKIIKELQFSGLKYQEVAEMKGVV